MQVMSVILFLAFAFLSAAVPTPESITMHTLIPRAEHNPRGVAFNKVKFPHLFNGPNSKVGWIYNWGSDLCGKAREATGSSVEYVPMLHSNKADHTRPWYVIFPRRDSKVSAEYAHLRGRLLHNQFSPTYKRLYPHTPQVR